MDGHCDYSPRAPTNLQIITVEFSVDFGSGLRRGKQTVLCLWPVADTVQLKKTLGWSAVVFYVCEIILFFCSVLRGFSCAYISL